ncbi:MAG: formyltransferase family protein [Anaerolineae bacterium]
MARLSILFFGMEGVFSHAPLAALLAADHDVRAVVVPRPYALSGQNVAPRLRAPRHSHGLTLQLAGQPNTPTIVDVAWGAGIPVLEIGRPSRPDTLAALSNYAPDVICVACFPYLLPPKLLTVAKHGGYNVHPSLLPAYRGPSPLFWVYHDGLEYAGVTIHQMDAGADTGDIARQQSVALADGTRYGAAERRLSGVGGKLLADVLDDIAAGRLGLHPQPTRGASPAPTPGQGDYTVATTWSARRAFNFIHGLVEWGRPFTIPTEEGSLVVRDAAAYDAEQALHAPTVWDGDRLAVAFRSGVVYIERGALEDYPPG